MVRRHQILAKGILLIVTFWSGVAAAENVAVVGIFGSNKAVLVIDGGAPKTVEAGQVIGNVRVIEISRDAVRVAVAGEPRRVAIGVPVNVASKGKPARSVTLVADVNGHFVANGAVNGSGVSFLVDTGATSVTLDHATATRLGIDLTRGEAGMAGTANGVIPTVRVRLAKVTVGDVTLYDVDGVVVPATMPRVLLGMSFLNRMEMRRDGSTMVLTQRY